MTTAGRGPANSGADQRGASFVRKVTFTAITAVVTYAITSLADRPSVEVLTLSVVIGGITLIVQFLNDFEGRLRAVEETQQAHASRVEHMVDSRFHKINEATELFALVEASTIQPDEVTALVRHSTRIDPSAPQLVQSLAHAQIRRTSDLLKELSEGADVIYEGEDREWLLGLTGHAGASIDAVSLTTVDAGSRDLFEGGGLWTSDLGQRYLEAQRQAVHRGVVVRRILVLDQPMPPNDSGLQRLAGLHEAAGIAVRLLDPHLVPRTRRHALLDFIVFDSALSYETTRASSVDNSAKAIIATTRLVLRDSLVKERIQLFEDLWSSARQLT